VRIWEKTFQPEWPSRFDEEEVIPELVLGEQGRIPVEVFVDQPQLAVVGVTGPVGVVPQRQRTGEPGHGIVGMPILDGIDEIPWGRTDRRDRHRSGGHLG
jgi:hypothetical protein